MVTKVKGESVFVPGVVGLVWETPPDSGTRHSASHYSEVVAVLRSRPGEWVRIHEGPVQWNCPKALAGPDFSRRFKTVVRAVQADSIKGVEAVPGLYRAWVRFNGEAPKLSGVDL